MQNHIPDPSVTATASLAVGHGALFNYSNYSKLRCPLNVFRHFGGCMKRILMYTKIVNTLTVFSYGNEMSPVPWDSDGDEGSQTHQSRSEGFSCFVGKKSRYSAIPLLHGSNQQKSDSLTMEKLKLYYFDIPGKGECIRLLCAYAGLCLEDIRIPLDNREVFDNLKKEGKLIFGQLPALQINDRGDMITQSAAIMRYLGKITTMYPKCPIEAALVDAIIDEEADLCTGLSVSRYRG